MITIGYSLFVVGNSFNQRLSDSMNNISFHYYIIVKHIYAKHTLRYIVTY